MKDAITKAGLAIIRQNRLLVVRNEGTSLFLMPGGRIERGESVLDALAREIREELCCDLISESVEYVGRFEDEAANDPGWIVCIELYRGEVMGTIVTANEVAEMRWFDVGGDDSRELSAIIRNKIVPALVASGLLTVF